MLGERLVFTWTVVRDGRPTGVDRSATVSAPDMWRFEKPRWYNRATDADGIPAGRYDHSKETSSGVWVYRRDTPVYVK